MRRVLKDYSLTCLQRFQLQQDGLEAVNECAKTLLMLCQDAMDMGCTSQEVAKAFEPLLELTK